MDANHQTIGSLGSGRHDNFPASFKRVAQASKLCGMINTRELLILPLASSPSWRHGIISATLDQQVLPAILINQWC